MSVNRAQRRISMIFGGAAGATLGALFIAAMWIDDTGPIVWRDWADAIIIVVFPGALGAYAGLRIAAWGKGPPRTEDWFAVIRKAMIVVLTLGALGTFMLAELSFYRDVEYSEYRRVAPSFEYTWIHLRAGSWTVEVTRPLQRKTKPWEYSYRKRWLTLEFGVGFRERYWRSRGTLLIPFVLFAAYPTIALIRGPLRRWRRGRRGLCVNCAYDLTGNVTGVCSECGTHFGKRP